MGKKIYLEALKSVLGRSISHYSFHQLTVKNKNMELGESFLHVISNVRLP